MDYGATTLSHGMSRALRELVKSSQAVPEADIDGLQHFAKENCTAQHFTFTRLGRDLVARFTTSKTGRSDM
jgi:hypothetical protein